jgi:hypothetical protein
MKFKSLTSLTIGLLVFDLTFSYEKDATMPRLMMLSSICNRVRRIYKVIRTFGTPYEHYSIHCTMHMK